MQIRLLESRLVLRNSQTRLPFRYGKACLTRCPQALMQVHLEIEGHTQVGYSGDCLPPGWFDKNPAKNYQQQIGDMLRFIRRAEKETLDAFSKPMLLFDGWRAVDDSLHQQAADEQIPGLVAGLAVGFMERAMLDAMARHQDVPLATLIHQNAAGIRAAEVHPELKDAAPRDWLPGNPLQRIHVRHTVGLGDPLTSSEVDENARPDDYPVALEEYVRRTGTHYFKIKVANRSDEDLRRLETIARVVESHRQDRYKVTIDGNEQYGSVEEFQSLVDAIRRSPALATLWSNVLAIEQPLARDRAFSAECVAGIREITRIKPVIIDESDQARDSFRQAVDCGYRGVSSKNCKGPLRSILNAGFVRQLNDSSLDAVPYIMTAEDLCTVGIVPVQTDLCLAALLGLDHVERNGHHYHPGLNYLPVEQQRAALDQHADLYHDYAGTVRPHVQDGQFHIESLQCPGYGFSVMPKLDAWTDAADWQFASLALDED